MAHRIPQYFYLRKRKSKENPGSFRVQNRKLSTLQYDFSTQNLYLNESATGKVIIYNLISGQEKEIRIDKGNMICEKGDFLYFRIS
ncbi:hypothetical protein EJ377_19540 [Chryseobacterium arthrosphaerae]|uniref:Uncharacterized protein n=1 Tax=Chryseobacterium arthrosphaerae TaxID=651561 RepID=A0A432DTP4_9FLAO|nr:hypothetical protein EJ377_19540 [Chryseobacterium arthrosphaerae]